VRLVELRLRDPERTFAFDVAPWFLGYVVGLLVGLLIGLI